MGKLMDAKHLSGLVDKYVEAFEQGSLELIKEIFADDAIVDDPVGSDSRIGIDTIVEFYKTGFDAGAKIALNGPVRCAGNSVAFPFSVDAMGMKIQVIDVFDVNADGKVSHMKAYWGPENCA